METCKNIKEKLWHAERAFTAGLGSEPIELRRKYYLTQQIEDGIRSVVETSLFYHTGRADNSDILRAAAWLAKCIDIYKETYGHGP